MDRKLTPNLDNCFFQEQTKDVICTEPHRNLEELLTTAPLDSNECKSVLEYILLRSAYFDLPLTNLHGHTICNAHYVFFMKRYRPNNCHLCKIMFGRDFNSTNDLRRIHRSIAFGIWLDHKLSMFDHYMCGSCRKNLETKYHKKDIIDQSQSVFSWIYDEFTIHTPSIASSSSGSVYQLNTDPGSPLNINGLKDFLVGNGFRGRVQATNSYQQLLTKSKKTFLRQLKQILSFILQILAPNDAEQVWNELIESEFEITQESYKTDERFGVIMSCIADAYNGASHWTTRRQLLSIVAQDVPLYVVQKFIPEATVSKMKAAKVQALAHGRGEIVDAGRQTKIRFTDDQISHFIQFILSPHITTDIPFGEKKIKLSSGDVIIVPNTIRNLIPSRIVQAYKDFCQECDKDFQPLSDTCLFEILHGCSASIRKSLQSLDYFACDGSNAFDILMNMCEELAHYGTTTSRIVHLKKALHEARNNLKNNYRLHIETSSEIADHCTNYSLSDPADKDWRQDCNHLHEIECDQCMLLSSTLNELRLLANECKMTDALKMRYKHRLDNNIQLIWEWKAHIMRGFQQDLARTDVLDNLQNDSVLVLLDWAMKWLPMKYREAQRDFFAKRGLSWDISYVIRTQKIQASSKAFSSSTSASNRSFEHRTFVHIFDNCTQNSRTVISILSDVLKRLKGQGTMYINKQLMRDLDPTIQYAYLRTDNAGCYHSAETLLSIKQLQEETGIFVRRFDFSDPQSGKSACDRMAAVISCNVQRYINQKNNVENSSEFVEAAKDTKNLSIFASKIMPQQISNKVTSTNKRLDWKGLTVFNNIQYETKFPNESKQNKGIYVRSKPRQDIQLTTWRSFGIGTGKHFVLSELNPESSIDQLVVTYEPRYSKNDWMQEKATQGNSDDHKLDSNEESSDSDNAQDDFDKHASRTKLFSCPDPQCIREFQRHSNLLAHLSTGMHKYKPNQLSLTDKAKLYYQNALVEDNRDSVPSIRNFQIIRDFNTRVINELKQGWALFRRKPQKQFSEDQKAYLTNKYIEGEEDGLKWNSSSVAEQMQTVEINGKYLFEPSEWLTASQIESYFSRLTSRRRQKNNIDQNLTTLTNREVSNNENDDYSDDEDDNDEILCHTELMQQSTTALGKQITQQSKNDTEASISPSMRRKLNHQSNDDLSNLPRNKRTTNNN